MTYYRPSDIMAAGVKVTGVPQADLFGYSKLKHIVFARVTIAGAAHHLTEMSYPEIATMMGKRWHSGPYGQVRRFQLRDPVEQADQIMAMRHEVERIQRRRLERADAELNRLIAHHRTRNGDPQEKA